MSNIGSYGGPELASAFRTVRKNTIQIAEDIPESSYDFVAAPGVRSIKQTLAHLVYAPRMYEDIHRNRLATLIGFDFPAAFSRARADEEQLRAKDEIVALLRSEGERFASWLESL